jgi:hypothetical protein
MEATPFNFDMPAPLLRRIGQQVPGQRNRRGNTMPYRALLTTVLATSLFAGCAVRHPQTAAEFRAAAPGATFGKKESFVVDRRFDEVAATFQEQAPKCLDTRIKMVESGHMYHHVVVTKYTPTILVSDDSAELHLQFIHEQGVMKVSEMPAKGYYLMVADASAMAGNRTQIDLYRPSIGYDTIVRAVKGWATGDQIGCPDLTQ